MKIPEPKINPYMDDLAPAYVAGFQAGYKQASTMLIAILAEIKNIDENDLTHAEKRIKRIIENKLL